MFSFTRVAVGLESLHSNKTLTKTVLNCRVLERWRQKVIVRIEFKKVVDGFSKKSVSWSPGDEIQTLQQVGRIYVGADIDLELMFCYHLNVNISWRFASMNAQTVDGCAVLGGPVGTFGRGTSWRKWASGGHTWRFLASSRFLLCLLPGWLKCEAASSATCLRLSPPWWSLPSA